MKYVGGYWIPDDPYFEAVFKEHDYFEIENLQAACNYVTDFNLAVDGGAHVGSWSCYMAKHFKHVLAYEPQIQNYLCLTQNVPSNVIPINMALGTNEPGFASLRGGSNSGCWHVDPNYDLTQETEHLVAVTTLPDLGALDLLKLDIEGYEYFALKGADYLIHKYRPVIIFEEKPLPHSYDCMKASEYIASTGIYELAEKVRRDQIWVPKSR